MNERLSLFFFILCTFVQFKSLLIVELTLSVLFATVIILCASLFQTLQFYQTSTKKGTAKVGAALMMQNNCGGLDVLNNFALSRKFIIPKVDKTIPLFSVLGSLEDLRKLRKTCNRISIETLVHQGFDIQPRT